MAEYLPDRTFADPSILQEMVQKEETPFFLYDHQGILDSISRLHGAFGSVTGYQNYFPIRENNNPVILKLLADTGTGVCACSGLELRIAEKCGFSGRQLLYEPGRKDPDAESQAARLHAVWLINGRYLLPDPVPEEVILRYHPHEMKMSPMQFPKIGSSKNGLTREQLLEAVKLLSTRGCRRIGLALQVSSYSIQPSCWEHRLSVLEKLAQEIERETGVTISRFHIGEGPGLPYCPSTAVPTLEEEAEKVIRCLKTLFAEREPELYTSVCSRLLECNGILVTKILEERVNLRTFLVLDAGIGQYIRPALKQAYRHISVLGRNETENRKLYSLVGEMPDEIDRLVKRGRMLPRVKAGDYCIIHDVGCGARSMAMLYGTHVIPAEYLCGQDGSYRQISMRRSEEEVAAFLTAW